MKFTFHPNAKIEFNNAIDYYEKRKAGLGREFANEIYETIEEDSAVFKSSFPITLKE